MNCSAVQAESVPKFISWGKVNGVPILSFWDLKYRTGSIGALLKYMYVYH